ncbi:MAG: hypothetical protein ACE3JN_03585 [Ectobacillus sp.]
MAKQHQPGTANKNQNIQQLGKQGAHNDVEFSAEQAVNAKSKSQKKSGK